MVREVQVVAFGDRSNRSGVVLQLCMVAWSGESRRARRRHNHTKEALDVAPNRSLHLPCSSADRASTSRTASSYTSTVARNVSGTGLVGRGPSTICIHSKQIGGLIEIGETLIQPL